MRLDPLSEPLRAVVAELNRVYLELGLESADVAPPSAQASLAEARMDAAAWEGDWPQALEALLAWGQAWLAAFRMALADAQPRDRTDAARWHLVHSDLLGEIVVLVNDESAYNEARAKHPDLAVYLPDEASVLYRRRSDPDLLRTIHEYKKAFEGRIREDTAPNVTRIP